MVSEWITDEQPSGPIDRRAREPLTTAVVEGSDGGRPGLDSGAYDTHFRIIDRCLACASSSLSPVIDLGPQPLANSYHSLMPPPPSLPLAVNVCPICFHAQLAVAVDPNLIFRKYPYVSATSKALRDYFDWFASYVGQSVSAREDKRVLDIGCNDGSQLAAFAANGWQTWGVDPAENLVARSRAIGAQTLCAFWTPQVARDLGMTFDAITAQNVFAHNADPLTFLEGCKRVMDKDSRLFIQTSQAEMFQKGQFDTIYHEHISFFSCLSMRTLAQRAGLAIKDVFTTPIHGTSYVFVLGYGGEGETVAKRIAEEERQGLYSIECYERFAECSRRVADNLRDKLQNELGAYRVVGFGAAAKGNTLLNFARIKLAYIVDNNERKQGLYTPGMNIPIHPTEYIMRDPHRLAVLVLAWNFFDEIRDQVRTLRPGKDDVLVTPFPEISVQPL